MFELSKQFRFDSAHTLERDVSEQKQQSSRRIHGHSYRAEITLQGDTQPEKGMIVDFDVLENALDALHHQLDHQMLNDIPGLGVPTMENLCVWIWQKLTTDFSNLLRVTVYRDSGGESCVYRGGRIAS